MPLPYSKPFDLNPAILGQMMAAENFVSILPTEQRIGEFTSGVIEKIPGVSKCRLCIGGVLSPKRKSPAPSCHNCRINFECSKTKSRSKCVLHEDMDFLSIALETASYFWGFLFLEVIDSDRFDPYYPFVKNFCNHIAIHLENRHQRKELRSRNEELKKRHNELDALVRLRTNELAESEEKFSSAFQNAPLLMTILSFEDGRFLDVNEAFITVTGYKREIAIGSTAIEIGWITAKERGRIIELLKKEGRVKNLVINVKCMDGSQLCCQYSGEIIEFGGKKCLLSTATDITERKKAERALRESEEKFHKAFYSAPLLMTITSIDDGKFIEINDAFVSLTGYPREIAIGSTSTEIGWVKKKVRNKMVKTLKTDGRVNNIEVPVNHADGSDMVCLYSAELIVLKGKNRLLSTAIDITERKEQEEKLKEKQTELEAHSKKLEEMNTALNVLIEHRSNEKENVKKDILRHFEKLVFPYFPSSKGKKTQEEYSTILSIIERNVKEILLKGDNKNLALYVGLTPMESQIAHLIKEGKTSKDIANILKMSVHTVYFHSENVRKKLNLTKSNTNLKTYLQAQS